MGIKITTNNHPRPIIEGYELSDSERKEFDYYDWDNIMPEFFRYKGELYDLDEFMATSGNYPDSIKKWDGIQSDTYFSGLVIKYTPDHEHVIVGRYCT